MVRMQFLVGNVRVRTLDEDIPEVQLVISHVHQVVWPLLSLSWLLVQFLFWFLHVS